MSYIILAIVALVLIISLFKSAFIKGVLGEFRVNLLLSTFLDRRKYHILKNITLPKTFTLGTSQIDTVVVSEYGIFPIETKNYRGTIYVKPNQKYWKQVFKHSSFSLYNPLWQNRTHISVLNTHIRLPKGFLHSIIVFAGSAQLKGHCLPKNITSSLGCLFYIKHFKEKIISKAEVQNIIEIIKKVKLSRSAIKKTKRNNILNRRRP